MLPELLDRKFAMGLLDMSRLHPQNRYKNELFNVCLKRKLRIDLWHGTGRHECPICRKEMDLKGDHLYSCSRISKTPMHDRWRDGVKGILEEILPLVKLIRSPSTIRREQKGLVRKLKNTRFRPGDISFRIDHYLGETEWRTPLQRLLFDVTNTGSYRNTVSLSDDARLEKNNSHLQNTERDKFQRKGHTNKKTNLTMTGEEIMRDHNSRKYGLLPIVITPYGMFGNIFDRFMFGTDPLPLPTYSKPHALQAAETAISPDVPFGVLQRANTIWRSNNASETYGSNYKEMDPLTTVTKKLGRLVCVANGEHLLHAMEKMDGEPISLDQRTHDDEEMGDSISHGHESDIALCSETRGYSNLMAFGSCGQGSLSDGDDSMTAGSSSSSPTDTSAMM